MTIIITDEDVKRLLPMRDCIEAMGVAFADLARGVAVNRPRVRYLAQHPDPERKYLANVHVGAVPSYGIGLRAGGLRAPSTIGECSKIPRRSTGASSFSTASRPPSRSH